MASEVKANKLSPATGVTTTLGDASDVFQLPASAEIDIASGATLDINGTADFTGATVTGLSAGLFSSYAIIADQKVGQSGTFTSGAWRTRDLNTEIADPDGIVSIASDQFTLAAGSYLIKWIAPAFYVNLHQTRLYNVTDAAQVEVGVCAFVNVNSVVTTSSGCARTTIAGSKAFTIEHYCATTAATAGFGQNCAFSVNDQYTLVEIFKEV
jgi:hypothetical protein